MPNHKYSEPQLCDLLRKKDLEAFSYLYDNYSPALFSIITRAISSHEFAADIMQQVFVKIWQKFEYYDPNKSRLFTWMAVIAKNETIDFYRSSYYREWKKNLSLEEVNVDAVFLTENNFFDTPFLCKYIKKLPSKERVIIELVYLFGYNSSQVAEICNLPLGTVKTRIRSSLSTLRSQLV